MLNRGQCHCGAIRLEFESEAEFAPRQCQCGFCRRHNVRMVSDPDGEVRLTLGPETQRYRFATATTDYLICGRCGVYVGAIAEVEGCTYATLNLNAFDDAHPDLAAAPVFYDGETAEQKAERRLRKWTPARLVEMPCRPESAA